MHARTERYSPKSYRNNLFRYYIVMRRHKTVSHLFRFFLNGSSCVLDLGCGIGEYLKYAIGENRTVIGVDLDKLELRCRKFDFVPIQGDVQNLSFKNAIFDLVLFSEVLEHLSCPEKALDEIRRILEPGGILITSTPSKKSVYEKQFFVFVVMFFIWVFQNLSRRKSTNGVGHISLQSPNELRDMLRKRNLKIIKEFYTGFCLPLTGELLNFLFRFKSVRKLYEKLDGYANRSKALTSLNWNMIFVCKKC